MVLKSIKNLLYIKTKQWLFETPQKAIVNLEQQKKGIVFTIPFFHH